MEIVRVDTKLDVVVNDGFGLAGSIPELSLPWTSKTIRIVLKFVHQELDFI